MAGNNGKINYNELVDQSAIEQLIAAKNEVKALWEAYKQLQSSVKDGGIKIINASGVTETESAMKKQREQLSELDKIKKQLITTQEKLTASETLYAQALAEEKMSLQDSTAATKNFIKERQAASGSVDQMEAKLVRLRKEFNALSESMRLGGNGQKLLADIQKLDSAVKMAKFSTGDFTKNVGNYQSATFQLTQVLRELPAFAYSTQTGIMGISNNLPILADAFRKVKAETGSAWQAIKVFGSSLFSFGNIFAVAVGLLTIFSDKLFASDKAMKSASKSVEDFKNAQDALNAAIASTDYKKAVHDVNELRINIDLAKKGFVDKKDVVNEYNKTLGDTMGKVTSLDEAEKMLVKNGEAYIQMTLLKAAANLALDKAAEQYLNAELKRQEDAAKLEANRDADGNYKPGALQSFKLLFSQGLGSDADNFKKQTKQEVDGIQKEGDRFKDIAAGFQKDASEIAKTFNMRLFGDEFDIKAKKQKKEKKKPVIDPNLSDTDLADLKAYYENLRKWQVDKLREWMDDPELRQSFDGYVSSLFSSREPLSDDQATKLAKELEKWAKQKADKLQLQIQLKIDHEKMMKELDMVVNGLKTTTDFLEVIADAQYQREMNRIKGREKALESSYKTEKELIEHKGLTQQQKEKEIANLEARTEAQRKQIEKDQIAAQRRRAQMQKGFDIANIISSTAVAVMSALGAKPYTPANIALAAAAAATGAVNLARVVATPIPQYWKGAGVNGRPEHQGGLAEVGERGIELGVLPSGQKFLTPGSSTIMDLPAKTKIIPHEILMQELYNTALVKMATGRSVTTDTMQAALIETFEENTEELRLLRKEMKSKKSNVSIYGNFDHYTKIRQSIS